MNALLLANPYSSSFLSAQLAKAINNLNKSNKREPESDKDDESNNITVISSQEEYKLFLANINHEPDYILIVPELSWTDTAGAFEEGYQKATELITGKLSNHFFQLIFLSVANVKQLIAHTPLRYHSLIKSFPHYCILELPKREIIFDHYSPIHFQLITSLVLADEGRLSQIEHDYSAIKNNAQAIRDDTQTIRIKKEVNEKVLNELMLFQQLNEASLRTVAADVNSSKEIQALKNSFDHIDKLIQDAKKNISLKDQPNKKSDRSPYNVLIIDDEKQQREVLSRIFAEKYNHVFPSSKTEIDSFDISEAKTIIKEAKNKYQIIVLDLLYKDENGFWLSFNGLDLYNFIEENNPFTCVRIITNLPRDLVAKTAGQLLKKEVRFDQVFSKTLGDESLKYIIHDRVIELNKECEENERRKKMFKPMPVGGIFRWHTVPNTLLSLLSDKRDLYNQVCEQVLNLYNLFKKGKLRIDTPGWDQGHLFSPQTKNKITESSLLKGLPSILTHRLLVIDFALKDEERFVFKEEYEEKVLQQEICNSTSLDKGYLTSKLGFNISAFSKKDSPGFMIKLSNLFPHEIAFVSEYLRNQSEREDSLKRHPELYDWFESILANMLTYDYWSFLNLPYNPYNEVSIEKSSRILPSDIILTLQLSHLNLFLQSLIDHFSKPFVIPMIEVAIGNRVSDEGKKIKLPSEKSVKSLPDIAFQINYLLEFPIE